MTSASLLAAGRVRRAIACSPGSALAGTVALVAALMLCGCTTSGAASRPAGAGSHPPESNITVKTTNPAPSHRPRSSGPLPVDPGAGRLPQTMTRPSAHDRAWHAMVTDLWLAVRTGKPAFGGQAFFPVGAYKQVKAIYDPAADWRGRLWLDFALDVKAAHGLLGRDARSARLVRVIIDSPGAVWVGPGACYNRTGYWHVANSRVVYRLHGQERSFGIASLISWRGVWYVVHFGGVVRPAVGMVDAPAVGPGYPGPQGGC